MKLSFECSCCASSSPIPALRVYNSVISLSSSLLITELIFALIRGRKKNLKINLKQLDVEWGPIESVVC